MQQFMHQFVYQFVQQYRWWAIASFMALGLVAMLGLHGVLNYYTPTPWNQLSELSTSPSEPPLPPLRTLAKQQALTIGAAVTMEPFLNDPAYRRLIAREFSGISPENAMKFELLQPQRNQFQFAEADALVDFAQAHDMKIHAHVLVWYRRIPDWLLHGQWSRDELKAILKHHIETVVGRYRGKIDSWDVVNEAVNMQGTGIRDDFWRRGIGPDYIDLAFQWAHAADPTAKLFYNDFGGEALGRKSDQIYQLVKGLRDRGVPIHGVGLQSHFKLWKLPSLTGIAANVKRLSDLGLEVQFTELDLRVHKAWGTQTDKLTRQAQVYQQITQLCLAAPRCHGITTWGVADHWSWVRFVLQQPDSPLLFDQNYQPKPAYFAVAQALRSHR